MNRFVDQSFHCENMVSWSEVLCETNLVEMDNPSVITKFLKTSVHEKHKKFREATVDSDASVAVGV